ncbi:MAG: PEP-CTERM sorting domain-containing protein [Pseudomonadota bacterium]|nr:PEP-CTERM sorting domain-containing protein [Pseudomonadota bacterium]
MRKVILAALITFIVSPTISLNGARAALMGADLLSLGDQLLTRDLDTNLDWLELTETTNLSVNDIFGGAGSFLTNGFRYASEAEVREFWSNAGILTLNTNATTPGADPAGRVAENIIPVMALMDLIGCTGNCATAGPNFTSGFAAPNELVVGVAQSPFIEFFDGNARSLVGTDICCPRFDSKQLSIGHWLVRPFQAPEPGTLTIFALGLLGVSRCRRRKRRGAGGLQSSVRWRGVTGRFRRL